jgi:hypothetical protein
VVLFGDVLRKRAFARLSGPLQVHDGRILERFHNQGCEITFNHILEIYHHVVGNQP